MALFSKIHRDLSGHVDVHRNKEGLYPGFESRAERNQGV